MTLKVFLHSQYLLILLTDNNAFAFARTLSNGEMMIKMVDYQLSAELVLALICLI